MSNYFRITVELIDDQDERESLHEERCVNEENEIARCIHRILGQDDDWDGILAELMWSSSNKTFQVIGLAYKVWDCHRNFDEALGLAIEPTDLVEGGKIENGKEWMAEMIRKLQKPKSVK